jgi:hypothetical protein
MLPNLWLPNGENDIYNNEKGQAFYQHAEKLDFIFHRYLLNAE